MEDLLKQVKLGLNCDLFYLSLYAALTIPDICSALVSEDGKTSGEKYKSWFDTNVAYKYEGNINGEDCWYYRCSLLHQGTSESDRSRYERILFIEPKSTTDIVHNCVVNNALSIDVRIFCNDIVSSAEKWLERNKNDINYKKNIERIMKRYSKGLQPYIIGVPVIS